MTKVLRSAAYRIAFIYSVAFALAVILLGFITFWAMHLAFLRQLEGVLKDESAALALEYRSDGPAELRGAIAEREAMRSSNALLYALFSRDGRPVAGSLRTDLPAAGLQTITFIDPREGPDRALSYAVDLPDGSRLVVAADEEQLEQIDKTVLAMFGIGFVAVIAIGGAGALMLGAYLRRRLGAISGAAEAIVVGDISQRIPVGSRDDEFDRLGRSLNAMLDRIAGLIGNLRQVSSDIAHDLRTPLARLRNQLEGGLRDTAGNRPQREVIKRAIARVDEVLSLFAAILRISEVESGAVRRVFQKVDLSDLVSDLAESYAPAVSDQGGSLRWTVEPGIEIEGDRELLAQATINLIENAQSHTPTGTAIQVALSRRNGTVCLRVADDGPGVPAADRERIVQRFTRLEGSRSAPGYGLGLNLVAAIARLHRAHLSFDDNKPGLAVTLEFPETAA